MMTAALTQQTYLPDNVEGVAKVHDFLAAHQAAGNELPEPQYFLAGSATGDQVEIPEAVYDVLLQVVTAMQQGLAVTIVPQAKTLTTQEAAELLNVSRPTLVKLLDAGEIPFEKPATHRRVLLRDVLAFREKRRQEQYDALDAMAYDFDDNTPISDVLVDLNTARKAVAVRRRRSLTS